MIKWEYATTCSEDYLNALGEKGWELVCVDHGKAYLKRQKPVVVNAEKP